MWDMQTCSLDSVFLLFVHFAGLTSDSIERLYIDNFTLYHFMKVSLISSEASCEIFRRYKEFYLSAS